MNNVRSSIIALRLISLWLLAVTLIAGCSSSRSAIAARTPSRVGATAKIPSKLGSCRPISEAPQSTLAGRVSELSTEEHDDVDVETSSSVKKQRRSSVTQVSNTQNRQSASEIVESSFVIAHRDESGRRPGRSATRLQIPKELPGAEAPPIDLPPHDIDDSEGRAIDIAKYFGDLPKVDENRVNPAKQGRHYSLQELQSIALSSNPLIPQAEAQVMALRGTALQAGLHPNPTIGYEADTVGSAGTPNYHGGFINTIVKTAGKLELAESVANVDVWNAELTRQKTRIELITNVRGAYFAALIARENIKVTEALVRFTDSVYQIQVDRLRGGLVSTYEPVQLRALAVQARTALTQARNRYDAAWRQLAAIVGSPDIQIGELDGSPEIAIPSIEYESALPYMISNHTDVLAARNSESQARINLRLQEVTRIPDLSFYTAVQRDYTTSPVYRTTFNMQVGVPVPIFDKNQGNILNAHGTLMKASQEAARVQNDLANRLADAIERYGNARNVVQMYRDHVLPDQARAYRGVYERHEQQPDFVGFADVVTAQQTLLVSIGAYTNSLAARWQALTDIGSLLQLETLSSMEDLSVDLDSERQGYGDVVPPGPIDDQP